ncbi:hypothetical protein M406DRAFT_327661 [Cryphonectria parasitica EP155]|uniref:Uncharacterized protein n=1 Tax=Cryphonectria parasitica (strain ATCC 38755 / EP155) TaxID=660469 RepID=A0A9P4YA86_CRYP1|nr:uncharacterized protein M406DRAFT_327661 [Cryphonectria parasitica EP155]KAF3769274.1 hypothetical protein M406DRAFT_327661 [Cryphonectria parasitica EP155]
MTTTTTAAATTTTAAAAAGGPALVVPGAAAPPGAISNAMQEFLRKNPGLAHEGTTRDAAAREHFGRAVYEFYDQNSEWVITRRAMAPAARPGGMPVRIPGGPQRRRLCTFCQRQVNDFSRHNLENHTRDPVKKKYCPYWGCDWTGLRDGTIPIDEHLACRHFDFRNTAGRGGALGDTSARPPVLRHLNMAALAEVARRGHATAAGLMSERARLLGLLRARGTFCPALEHNVFNQTLLPPHADADVDLMKKDERIEYVVALRTEVAAWRSRIHDANLMLAQ